jgi:hypothetical protein
MFNRPFLRFFFFFFIFTISFSLFPFFFFFLCAPIFSSGTVKMETGGGLGLWGCDLEVFVAWVTCNRCWAHEIEVIGARGCRRELVERDSGGSARGLLWVLVARLGVLMGASVGLGFGYLGGVVVSAWPGVGFSKGFLSRSRPGLGVCTDLGGLRREAVWPVGHRRGETKKKREMRREKKKVKIK